MAASLTSRREKRQDDSWSRRVVFLSDIVVKILQPTGKIKNLFPISGFIVHVEDFRPKSSPILNDGNLKINSDL